jgi:co-chaperonin GroES (HSP10)
MHQTYKATGTHLMLLVAEPETVTPGGIHLPQGSAPKAHKGVVCSVGPFVEDEDYRPGDVVHYRPYAGHDVEGFRVVDEKDILLIERRSDSAPGEEGDAEVLPFRRPDSVPVG